VSYVGIGLGGLIAGMVIGALALGTLSPLAGLTGMGLLIMSFATLSMGAEVMRPGNKPHRCANWGHDWRKDLEAMPPGATCRNCLARRDRAVPAMRWPGPWNIPTMHLPWAGLLVPLKAGEASLQKLPRQFVLIEPGFPRVDIRPGAPVVLPPAPRPPEAAPATVDFVQPREGPLRARVVEAPAGDTLCARCFAVARREAGSCAACGAPL
jgi:hypothetical protein